MLFLLFFCSRLLLKFLFGLGTFEINQSTEDTRHPSCQTVAISFHFSYSDTYINHSCNNEDQLYSTIFFCLTHIFVLNICCIFKCSFLHLGNFCPEGTLIKTNILHSVNVIMSGSLHVLWSDPRLPSHGGISWKIPYLPQGGNLGSIYVFFVVDKKITNGQLIFQDYSKLLINTVNFKTLKQMKTCF